MKDTMNVVEFNSQNKQTYSPRIIELYRKVFSESSWQEWLKCGNNCGFNCSYSAAPSDNRCLLCQEELTDFYSQEDVEWFIQNFLQKSKYQACLWIDQSDQVIAFTWWWVDNLLWLNMEKLWLNQNEFTLLSQQLSQIWCDPQKDFYYRSETWVDPDKQSLWFWKQITTIEEQSVISKSQIQQILERTSRTSAMFNIARRQWFKIVYDYKDNAQRVLLAKNN